MKTNLSLSILLSILSVFNIVNRAVALPENSNVTAGNVSIDEINQSQLNINQSSDRAIINWDSFNIDQPETVNINQPSNTSALLNRVTGDTRSNIAGSLNANGQVMLVNPNGILFTPTANINVGGLFASTLDITNTDFLNNNLNFFSVPGKAPATVENYGNITVGEAGIAALVAPGVINNGVITARLGKVILASGERFTLDFYGDGLISIELDPVTASQIITADGTPLTALITNNGSIYNDGGYIQLSAKTASDLLNQTINMNGVLIARSVNNINGNIVLGGETGVVNVNGLIDVSGNKIGETGGKIEVFGHSLNVSESSLLDASGYEGGGFVETSASYLNIEGLADTSSINGETGMWLIDPADLYIAPTINSNTTGNPNFNTTGSPAFLTKATLESALVNNNVTITTAGGSGGNGDITLNAIINSSSNKSLTLTARNFILTSGSFNLSGNLIFNLNAVNSGSQAIAPTSSIQKAIDAIGTMSGGATSTINLGNGTFAGATLNINKNVTIQAYNTTNPSVLLDGQNARQVVNITGGNVTLNNLKISNGRNPTGIAGGIRVGSGVTVNINNSTISSNTAKYGAGIFNDGTVTMTNSTISNNQGAEGILNNGTLNMTNSTMSGNSTPDRGGAIFNQGGTVTMTNSTISGNTATGGGGGIYNTSGIVNINNSIIANNSGTQGLDLYNFGGTVNASGVNIVENLAKSGLTAGTTVLAVDPLLAPLGNYGGTTQTQLLLPGSPAINAGVNNALTTDQRGGTRVVGGTVDIGATEFQGATFTITGGNNQSTTVNTAFSPLKLTITENVFNNSGLTGAIITFTPTAGASGASILGGTQTATSNAGVVSFTPTANTISGTHTVVASATGLPSRTFNLTNDPDVPIIIIPTILNITGGNNQNTVVNTAFASALQVQVKDQFGNVIPGASLTFTVPGSGASVQGGNQTIATNPSGIASLNVTANTIAGSYQIVSSINSLSTNFNLTNNPDVTSKFSLNGFLDPITAGTQDNFTVTAQDQYGNTTPNYNGTVIFSSNDTQAALPTSSNLTSGIGTFNATLKTAGERSLTATDGSITGSQLNITVNPDVPNILNILGGNNQNTTVNNTFANALQVEVKDKYGNVIPNANLTFTVPGSGASVQGGNQTIATNPSGIASLNVTANTISGTYQIASSINSLSTNFNLTNNPDIPANLNITGGNNQTTVVNTAFANALEVEVTDKYGNVIPNANLTFNFTAPNTGASIQETTQDITTDANGIASLNVTANTISGTYQISSTTNSLNPVNFNLTNNPDVPNSLTILGGDGQNTVVNTAFANALEVQVKDQYGNVIPDANLTFTVPNNGAGVQELTQNITTDGNGIASLNVTANTISGNYQINSSINSLNTNFNLTNNPDDPFSLNILGGNNQNTKVNTAFANALEVQVKDQYGNVIPDANLTFTVPNNGAGVQESTQDITTDGNGIASLNVTANNIAGLFSILGSTLKLTPVEFSLTNVALPVVNPPVVNPPVVEPPVVEPPIVDKENKQFIFRYLEEIEGGRRPFVISILEDKIDNSDEENQDFNSEETAIPNESNSNLLICVQDHSFGGKVPFPDCNN